MWSVVGFSARIDFCCVAGWYGVPSGMMVTMPVRFEYPGEWQVVPDVDLIDTQYSKLKHIIRVSCCIRPCYVFQYNGKVCSSKAIARTDTWR